MQSSRIENSVRGNEHGIEGFEIAVCRGEGPVLRIEEKDIQNFERRGIERYCLHGVFHLPLPSDYFTQPALPDGAQRVGATGPVK